MEEILIPEKVKLEIQNLMRVRGEAGARIDLIIGVILALKDKTEDNWRLLDDGSKLIREEEENGK